MTTSALLVVLKVLYDDIKKLDADARDRAIKAAETKGEINILAIQISRIQSDLGAISKLREDVNVCHKRIRELTQRA